MCLHNQPLVEDDNNIYWQAWGCYKGKRSSSCSLNWDSEIPPYSCLYEQTQPMFMHTHKCILCCLGKQQM